MDTWSALAPALLSLAGVGLGAVGSLVGQHLASRVNVRQIDAQQWAAHRAELKESIMRFLASIHRVEQSVEQAARDHSGERRGDDPSVESLLYELWLAQHELDLVAVSEPLRGATYRYARGVTAVARRELPAAQDQAGYISEVQIPFMDAARKDLWPAGAPVARVDR